MAVHQFQPLALSMNVELACTSAFEHKDVGLPASARPIFDRDRGKFAVDLQFIDHEVATKLQLGRNPDVFKLIGIWDVGTFNIKSHN